MRPQPAPPVRRRRRGVVEGFRGPVWSPADRLGVLAAIAAADANAYLWAPRDDPWHRERWRDPFPAGHVAMLTRLVAEGRARGVEVGVALACGLGLGERQMTAEGDALIAKVAPVLAVGCRWLVLAFDDIPARGADAVVHAAITTRLHRHLQRRGVRLDVVPRVCSGPAPDPYLVELCAWLPGDVGVIWTGPQAVSGEITAGQVAAWRAALGTRGLTLWENFPVNDLGLRPYAHLGPVSGREPQALTGLDAVLVNPMAMPYASLPATLSVLSLVSSPGTYDPAVAHRRALRATGAALTLSGAQLGALLALGEALSFGPPRCRDATTLEHLVLAVALHCPRHAASGHPRCAATRVALRARLARLASLGPSSVGAVLGGELAGHLGRVRLEATACLRALDVLDALHASSVPPPWLVDGHERAWALARDAGADTAALGRRLAREGAEGGLGPCADGDPGEVAAAHGHLTDLLGLAARTAVSRPHRARRPVRVSEAPSVAPAMAPSLRLPAQAGAPDAVSGRTLTLGTDGSPGGHLTRAGAPPPRVGGPRR